MRYEHDVIVVPGLGNDVERHVLATSRWKRVGIVPHVFDAKWKIEEPDFTKKLDRALNLVDSLAKQNRKISLVGNSAGSSFVLNIFGERKNSIHRVVINGGRIRTGDWPWWTFDRASASSPSFRQSVLMAEKTEVDLSLHDRARILTLRPIFDQVVPPSTVPIEGARNEVVPSVGHAVSIALNMTLFKRKIIEFILT